MPGSDDSPKLSDEFLKGVWKENPVLVAVLGLCPALAVTNTLINALAMGAATFCVLVGSSLLISTLRNTIPRQVRIPIFIIVIATFVTVVDYSLAALFPMVHKQLGAFISLIVANCLILGRQEAFASKNKVSLSLADAVGMATGFTLALVAIGSIRELLGTGALGGVSLFGDRFEPWVIMSLPPGGFFTLGLLLLIIAYTRERRSKRQTAQPVVENKQILTDPELTEQR